MYWVLMSSIIASFGGIWLYIFYWRKGQFEDSEDVKYQMFRDQENDTHQERDGKQEKR